MHSRRLLVYTATTKSFSSTCKLKFSVACIHTFLMYMRIWERIQGPSSVGYCLSPCTAQGLRWKIRADDDEEDYDPIRSMWTIIL